jgi:large subunit ribosomal protein L13
MSDMNKTFFLRKEDRAPQWWILDAQDLVLGRISTHIADILRGKNKPGFTHHTDGGDYVVVINAEKVKLTGNKLQDKEYDRYTGYQGGYKITTAAEMLKKHPERVIEHSVKGMLPKNVLSRQIIKKLKVYAGTEHPHVAQGPKELKLKA